MLKLGDIVQTKKPHPCGSSLWEVVRTGADYKLRCNGCGRVLLFSSVKLQATIKKIQSKEQNEGQ